MTQRKPFVQERAVQAGLAHQPLDPLAGHPDAPPAQDGVHPRRAVGATGDGVDVGDLGGERPVGAPASGQIGGTPDPAVERRRRDAQNPEDGLDPKRPRSCPTSLTAVAGSGRVPRRKKHSPP
jgi:hypothetical protein